MSPAEKARKTLDSIPWWRPLKRQEAARQYRQALLAEALRELNH